MPDKSNAVCRKVLSAVAPLAATLNHRLTPIWFWPVGT